MTKTLAILAIMLVALCTTSIILVHTVHAQTLKNAQTQLTRAERTIAPIVTRGAQRALGIEQTLDNGDRSHVLPAQLRDFLRSTKELTAMRDQLRDALETYLDAVDDKLAAFDHELASIHDEHTLRTLRALREETALSAEQQRQAGHETFVQIVNVLAQGADLEHAANCVIIAEELHQQQTNIAEHIAEAKQQAAAYAERSHELLNKLASIDTNAFTAPSSDE